MAFEFPQLAYPLVLFLISPVVLAGWYAIRRGIPKLLTVSRVVILSLLIIALASPYTLGTSTIRDEAPRITIVSDKTLSMDLFNKDTAQKLFESVKSTNPSTAYKQFAGIKSPIGDEVIQDAEGNNNIVLVSDGNNNYGKDLFDAITFVSKSGTKVFAVRQAPVHNDASVEIQSAKNLIIDNPNEFNIVVRQAGNEMSYKLDVDIDGTSVLSQTFTQTERVQNIPVSYTFTSLGTHRVTAKITPSSEDWNPLNNVFYRSVYVVPKPRVLMVTDDRTSPLYKVASSLYQVTTSGDVPDDLSQYKAVIIDNKGAAQLSADSLRKYVGGGGGLVVVGGDAAYDKGNYNNSPVEAILPIISRAAEYKGGRNILILIDVSGSTLAGDVNAVTGEVTNTAIEQEDNIAANIAGAMTPDSNVGVIGFGGKVVTIPFMQMTAANKNKIKGEILKFEPTSGANPTNLIDALKEAIDVVKKVTGSKEIIVLSDGKITENEGGGAGTLNDIIDAAKKLQENGVTMMFIQVRSKENELKRDYETLADSVGGRIIAAPVGYTGVDQILQVPSASATPTPTTTPAVTYEFPLVAIDTSHFITQYLNLTASVTGYNDVTPKLGSDELVATTDGKPIVTTWGFGLGRVVSFTTDNGNPSNSDPTRPWASQVYSAPSSALISSMINWAIGDPRPKEGVVIQAEDIWGGTPGKVIVTSKTPPIVKLDGKTDINPASKGPNTFEYSLNFDKDTDRGFHDLSGYGIAVNYPLEYRDVGFNKELTAVIEANGGSVYDESAVEGLLLLDIKEKSVRNVQQPINQKEPFLLAALGLFLAEVIVRRMKDYRKERPVIEDNPQRIAPAATE